MYRSYAVYGGHSDCDRDVMKKRIRGGRDQGDLWETGRDWAGVGYVKIERKREKS
jgi:hypothetical protein